MVRFTFYCSLPLSVAVVDVSDYCERGFLDLLSEVCSLAKVNYLCVRLPDVDDEDITEYYNVIFDEFDNVKSEQVSDAISKLADYLGYLTHSSEVD